MSFHCLFMLHSFPSIFLSCCMHLLSCSFHILFFHFGFFAFPFMLHSFPFHFLQKGDLLKPVILLPIPENVTIHAEGSIPVDMSFHFAFIALHFAFISFHFLPFCIHPRKTQFHSFVHGAHGARRGHHFQRRANPKENGPNKKLLGAPGIATRSKDATRGSWPYY